VSATEHPTEPLNTDAAAALDRLTSAFAPRLGLDEARCPCGFTFEACKGCPPKGSLAPCDNGQQIIPMPGRLSVSYRDQYGWMEPKAPLDEVITGAHVTATGTVTRVRYVDTTTTGRVMIVLADDAGDSAHVTLNPDVVRMIQPVLHDGTRLRIRGTVTRTTTAQPAGIDGLGVREVA